MVSDNKEIILKNNTNSNVCYVIPDMNNLTREFQPREAKKVTMDEIRRLSYVAGGMSMLKNYLFIDDKEASAEILGEEIEPEYYYTEDDVKVLLETGSLDQFEDFLNFAPLGLKDLCKDMAVQIEVNDNRKRELIKKKLGFDVTKAIELLKDDEDDGKTLKLVPEKKQRKAKPIEHKEETKPVRKYNVVSK